MIDVELIIRRRHELGRSQRQVARQLGTSPMTVIVIEGGTNHDDLPLRLISRLADILSLETRDLLARPAPAEPKADAGSLAEVGALLASAEGGVTLDTLAEATGRALDASMRVHQLGLESAVRLAPDGSAITDEHLAMLLRGKSARAQLTRKDAELIHRMLTETVPARLLQQSNARRLQLGKLINAGIIVAPERRSAPLEFTAEAKLSLMLTD